MPAAAELGPYLDHWTRQRFDWKSQTDCGLGFVAGWVEIRTGIDPAAALRGRYSTSRGAARCVTKAGGARVLYAALAARVGWSQREGAPQIGDVGLVLGFTRRTKRGRPSRAKRNQVLVGAICAGAGPSGARAAVFADNGLIVAVAPFVCAWGP